MKSKNICIYIYIYFKAKPNQYYGLKNPSSFNAADLSYRQLPLSYSATPCAQCQRPSLIPPFNQLSTPDVIPPTPCTSLTQLQPSYPVFSLDSVFSPPSQSRLYAPLFSTPSAAKFQAFCPTSDASHTTSPPPFCKTISFLPTSPRNVLRPYSTSYNVLPPVLKMIPLSLKPFPILPISSQKPGFKLSPSLFTNSSLSSLFNYYGPPLPCKSCK